MKSIIKLLFFAACIGLFAGCEKDEMIPDQNDPILKKAVKLMVQPCSSADVLTKAETDWQNISESIAKCRTGRGGATGCRNFLSAQKHCLMGL